MHLDLLLGGELGEGEEAGHVVALVTLELDDLAVLGVLNYTAIARKHGVTISALKEANPAVDPNRIGIGQVLVIPSPIPEKDEPELIEGVVQYEVKAGDNLYTIAKNHKTTVKAIRDRNDLKTSNIRPGQKLIIPKKAVEE